MTPETVVRQLRDVFIRMIESGLSQRHFEPADRMAPNAVRTIGDTPSTAFALKNIPYKDIYAELDNNNAYHIKLPDGGLLIFQYSFSAKGELLKHRLAYFPCPTLPTLEEAPELYERDELYADILSNQIVRFPIRADFDPTKHINVLHPQCHLTLGQFENCRIPLKAPVSPYTFTLFLLRNFYHRCYIRHKNKFDKKAENWLATPTISIAEQRICHFVA